MCPVGTPIIPQNLALDEKDTEDLAQAIKWERSGQFTHKADLSDLPGHKYIRLAQQDLL